MPRANGERERSAIARMTREAAGKFAAAAGPPLFPQLVRQCLRVVNFAERFLNGARMHAYRAGLGVGVQVVEHKRLDVAVENDTDQLARLVHDGTARIAADDVARADEVEGRRGIDLIAGLQPRFGQFEWLLAAVGLGMLERAAHRCPRLDLAT